MTVLRATDAGFHVENGAGLRLGPDLSLRSGADPDATATLSEPGRLWDVAALPGFAVTARSGVRLDPDEGRAPIRIATFDAVRIARIEADGSETVIGRMRFETPPEAVATQVSLGPDGADTVWVSDLGRALVDHIQGHGIRAIGGGGDDVLGLDMPILPIRGPVLLSGRAGDDRITGSLADDRIRGGAGDDVISDAAGHNRISAGRGADEVTLGAWSEQSVVRGGRGDDRLVSSNGADRLAGNAGADLLDGGRGSDRLIGGSGADTIHGGDGEDRILGGPGDDRLTGGWDTDVFVFRAGRSGIDRIADFDPVEDRVRLLGDHGPVSVEGHGDDSFLSWSDGEGVWLTGVTPSELGQLADWLI